MAKQSARDRANRLRSGCCPLHGLAMSQVGLTGDEARPFLVECTRKDCDIRGTSAEPYGEVSCSMISGTCLGRVLYLAE